MLEPVALNNVSRALLLKIYVITGWVLPSNELMTVMVDQFQKRLKETYFNLNSDEIELAFRQCGTTIQDWGKEMNLSLIDQVLIPYVNKRFFLSHEEERLKAKAVQEQKVYTDEELDNLHRQDVEEFYQRLRNGFVPRYKLPEYYKEIMVKDGLMEKSHELDMFFLTRLQKRSLNIYKKSE